MLVALAVDGSSFVSLKNRARVFGGGFLALSADIVKFIAVSGLDTAKPDFTIVK